MVFASNYPRNFSSDAGCSFDLNDYCRRLDQDDTRLFGTATAALVDCLELQNVGEGEQRNIQKLFNYNLGKADE